MDAEPRAPPLAGAPSTPDIIVSSLHRRLLNESFSACQISNLTTTTTTTTTTRTRTRTKTTSGRRTPTVTTTTRRRRKKRAARTTSVRSRNNRTTKKRKKETNGIDRFGRPNPEAFSSFSRQITRSLARTHRRGSSLSSEDRSRGRPGESSPTCLPVRSTPAPKDCRDDRNLFHIEIRDRYEHRDRPSWRVERPGIDPRRGSSLPVTASSRSAYATIPAYPFSLLGTAGGCQYHGNFDEAPERPALTSSTTFLRYNFYCSTRIARVVRHRATINRATSSSQRTSFLELRVEPKLARFAIIVEPVSSQKRPATVRSSRQSVRSRAIRAIQRQGGSENANDVTQRRHPSRRRIAMNVEVDTLELEVFEVRDEEGADAGVTSPADGENGPRGSGVASSGQQGILATSGGTRRKKRKRRKSKNKLDLQLPQQQQQQPHQRHLHFRRHHNNRHQLSASSSSHVVVNFASSCDELEPAGECSKSRDSSSSLGGPSNNTRHTTLRESLLTVLGKLVVWKGTRYRATPTSSTSAVPNSPPPTECIGRSTVFFSSKTERRIRANNREYNSQFNYANNYIKTSKYSVLTFLPLNLFEQFQRLANFYFLCLLVLQMIPAISSLTPITTAIPLIGVLTLTAVKDAYDDFQRHSSDSQVNNRRSQTLRGTNLRTEKWSQVQVGDVIRMENDQFVAADVLLLSTSEPNGLCYIETAELDGETNLKCRQCLIETAEMMDNNELIGEFDGEIVCETPNNLLNKFDGTLTWRGNKYILDNDKIILRGCVLRNTQWCYGVVIFAGRDTKLMQNSGKTKFKRTSIDRLLNLLIIGIVFFLLSLCAFCMIGCGIWESLVGRYFQVYLPWDSLVPSEPLSGATVIALLVFFSYSIVLNTVVPISLYVSVEVIRFVQSFLINWDEEMYHAPTNTHAKARTTTLNEELGQIEYIFSDKTGTLTQNIMTFNKCSVAGKSYGDIIDDVTGEVIDLSEKEKNAPTGTVHWKSGQEFVRRVYSPISGANARLLEQADGMSSTTPEPSINEGSTLQAEQPSTVPPLDFSFNKDYEEEFKFYDPALLEAVRRDNEDVHSFFRLLALCHTVMPEDKHGKLEYQAQSPDEAALVSAARNFGFVFRERSPNSITIDVAGNREVYELLCILDFNNVRKRMSVILRRNGHLRLYCKGADNVIYERLKKDSEEMKSKTLEHLNKFAGEGLRTLCLSVRDLDESFFNNWKQRHQEAAVSTEDRDDKLDAIYEEIEKDMTLLGATAIEDKLQDGVPQSIANLGLAGIKLWVLTGDKQETAINIGYSCQLLTDDLTDVFIVDATTYDGVETQLTRYLETIKTASNHQNRPALSIVTFRWDKESDADYNHSRDEPEEHEPELPTGFAVVINGHSLVHALHPQLELLFLEVSSQCKSVICCRVTPLQKAMVVELIKKNKEAVTLAIGDGANDVSMIKAAHIGVGISGQEGLQAVLASDYSIGQFRFLERLLLVHGRWSYYRMCKFLRYFFYKNFAFTLCHIWFAFFCGFSAQTVFDPMYISVYNLFYTSLPVLSVGIFDQDVNDKNSLLYPKLYTPGHKNLLFNKKEFCWSALHGFFASCVLFLVPYGTYKDGVSPKGYVLSDHMLLGSVVATILVIVVTVQIALDTSYWTIVNHIMVWGSVIWYFILDYFYNFIIGGSYVGSLTMAMSEATFWFTTVITCIILVIPVLSWRFFFIDVRPTLSERVRLKQRLAQLRSRQSQDILRTPSTKRTRRSLRSGYAFAHQEGFGRLITSGKIMRKLPNGSDFKFAMPFTNNVSKQTNVATTSPKDSASRNSHSLDTINL